VGLKITKTAVLASKQNGFGRAHKNSVNKVCQIATDTFAELFLVSEASEVFVPVRNPVLLKVQEKIQKIVQQDRKFSSK
jgi:hypothetical protein